MKKVLFYIENKWAFGAIHYGLCKVLYSHGIHCDLLNWDLDYTRDEFKFLIDTYDSIVTTPVFVSKLHLKYDVPLNKIIAVAHGQWDVLHARRNASFDFYPELKSFTVISNILKQKCIEWGISVTPIVTETGINFDFFYNKPSSKLKIVGYGGAKSTYNFAGEEIKRGHLVEESVLGIGLELKSHNFYNFLCMPGYYKTIDALVMSSSEEAGGLPIMEAAAAGKLVLGTPVGYFEEHSDMKNKARGGILLPLKEKDFISELSEQLIKYSKDKNLYKLKCLQIQEYARENYDWSKKLYSWLNLLA